jgi:hypothetical protein
MIAESFEAIAKSYGLLETVDDLWDLYPPVVPMFWSLQSVGDNVSWDRDRRDHRGGEEEGGGSGEGYHQGGRKNGRCRKGRKKTAKPKRDIKFGRFPRDNERFFCSARDYMKADSQYADWDHTSIEYKDAQAQEEDADRGDDDLGEDLGDDDLADHDSEDDDEAWWYLQWNSTTRTVSHRS